MTWYDEAFAKSVSLTDMGMRPNATTGNPGRSHRFYQGTPVFAFGEGLSYTSFAITKPQLELPEGVLAVARREAAARTTRAHSAVIGHVSVRVTNEGARRGAHSVLLFAAPPPSAVNAGAPQQNVLDFGKVDLAAGASSGLTFEIRAHDLTFADRRGARVAAAGAWRFWAGKATDGHKEAAVTNTILEHH